MEMVATYTKTGGSQLPRRSIFTSTDCSVGPYPHYMSVCGGSPFLSYLVREPSANIKSRTVRAGMKHNDFKHLTTTERIKCKLYEVKNECVRAIGGLTSCFFNWLQSILFHLVRGYGL